VDPYYRRELALVHHRGFGFHADACAPGILHLLEPVREAGGTVLEIGCGSGLLTRHLVDAGHRVIASDASPAMLDLAREYAPGVEEIRALVLPDDVVPPADAIVGVGHALNYLPNATAVDCALVAFADALRTDGILAIDLCDLEWGAVRRDQPPLGRAGDDWAIVTEFSVPAPDRYVRQMAVFVRDAGGTWRRDDERHDNVLVLTASVPRLLARHGVEAEVRDSFGTETLPQGLKAVVGRKLRVSADAD
jgi:SAM-dependent methyltransferase